MYAYYECVGYKTTQICADVGVTLIRSPQGMCAEWLCSVARPHAQTHCLMFALTNQKEKKKKQKLWRLQRANKTGPRIEP